jgi:hypothetical protein
MTSISCRFWNDESPICGKLEWRILVDNITSAGELPHNGKFLVDLITIVVRCHTVEVCFVKRGRRPRLKQSVCVAGNEIGPDTWECLKEDMYKVRSVKPTIDGLFPLTSTITSALATALTPTITPTLAATLAATIAPTLAATLAATIAPTLAATLAVTLAVTLTPTISPTFAAALTPTLAAALAPTIAAALAAALVSALAAVISTQTSTHIGGVVLKVTENAFDILRTILEPRCFSLGFGALFWSRDASPSASADAMERP